MATNLSDKDVFRIVIRHGGTDSTEYVLANNIKDAMKVAKRNRLLSQFVDHAEIVTVERLTSTLWT